VVDASSTVSGNSFWLQEDRRSELQRQKPNEPAQESGNTRDTSDAPPVFPQRPFKVQYVTFVDSQNGDILEFLEKSVSVRARRRRWLLESQKPRRKLPSTSQATAAKQADQARRVRGLVESELAAPFGHINIEIYNCTGITDLEETNSCTQDFGSSTSFPTDSDHVNRLIVDTIRSKYLYQSMSGQSWLSFTGQEGSIFKIYYNYNDDNAFWSGSDSRVGFGYQWDTDDIVGHEWAHAYTEYSSTLLYFYESGALNEAFSDIFGEVLDYLNNGLYLDLEGNTLSDHIKRLETPTCSANAGTSGYYAAGTDPSSKWLIGDEGDLGVIRDMYYPECSDAPSTTKSAYMYCGTSDNGT
jgi:Zn-dependent metalloprotease